MLIGLTYDLRQDYLDAGYGEEETAEFDRIDTIEGMIRNGALPHGETCVVSGQPTEDTVILRVQCERAWARGPRLDAFDRTIIGFFLLSWIGAIVGWCRRDKSSKDIGHERHVDVPLRVRADLQEQFRRKGPKAMKAMLRQVPVYDALLNEYPEAAVEVLSAGGSRNGL